VRPLRTLVEQAVHAAHCTCRRAAATHEDDDLLQAGSGAESSIDVPASSPAGGKTIKRPVTVPILPGQAGTIYVQCTAWNAGGESARTAVAAQTADRR